MKNVQAAIKQYFDQGSGVWGTAASAPTVPSNLSSRSTALAGFAIQMDVGETDVDLFRNRLYVWDFGDTGSGSWQDGKPKNSDVGPIAGHVYETPGTYAISCKVYDSTGLISTLTDSVTITDPDVVYAGALTICLSTGTDFTGAPAGSTHVTLTDLSLLSNYVTTGKRVLFKRGDTWTGDATAVAHNYLYVDDVYLGAFGAGVSPDEVGIFTNDPQITITGSNSTDYLFRINYCSRWIFSHLSLIGASTAWSWTGGNTNLVDITYLRTKSEGFYVPLGSGNFATQGHIGLSYVSNKGNNAEGNVLFTGSEKLLLLGNIFTNARTSHVTRIWQGYHYAIRHNVVSGSSLDNANGRQLIKNHGPGEAQVNPTGPWTGNQLRVRTEFGVISDNDLGAGGPFPLNVGPQDDFSDERLKAIIIENNRSAGDFGLNSSRLVAIGIRVTASNSVIRNNIVDATGMQTDGVTAVELLSVGPVAQREDTHVYNNSLYLKEGVTYANQAHAYVVGTGFLNAVIKNNLSNIPASATTPPLLLIDNGTSTTASSNLLTSDARYTDANNVDPLLRDFSLLAGSPAIGAGENVPVFQDRDGTPRVSGAYDIGAYQE